MAELILKPGREKSLLHRHPWLFSGAVARLKGDAQAGDTVRLYSANGEFLALAAYSPHSQIIARVWSWNEQEEIGPEFFRRRLNRAMEARRLGGMVQTAKTNALRLVYAESDGLPGVVVDRYADLLVLQLLTVGADRWREALVAALIEQTGLERIYERSDAEVRSLEGLPPVCGPRCGGDFPLQVLIHEHGLRFWVDVAKGHKTGFYLDQRENRCRVRALAAGREVLDCFCYTGSFTANALAGGAAQVTAVDSSGEALRLARENIALNDLPLERVSLVEGDVFQVLRSYRDARRSFDLIILDPPKFAPTAALAQKAARGYKDINLLALKLLRPGGVLVTFSCSGGISRTFFHQIIAGAALDAQVEAQMIGELQQAADHPVALNFPEGEYLKGLIIRRLS